MSIFFYYINLFAHYSFYLIEVLPPLIYNYIFIISEKATIMTALFMIPRIFFSLVHLMDGASKNRSIRL